MKAKIIIILAVIILFALSAFAVKSYIDNSVVDKKGMVREAEYNASEATDLFG